MPTFLGSRRRIFHDTWRPGGPARGAVVLLRLRQRTYDPGNLFHRNANIKPM